MSLNKQSSTVESISVREFYESFKKDLSMKLLAGEKGLDNMINEKSVNRPALALTGYFKRFATKRLQLFGAGEMAYLRDLSKKEQVTILTQIAQKNIPCMILSRNLPYAKTLLNVATRQNIPLIHTPLTSKDFTAKATVLLEKKLAPRSTVHGTLLDIKGIGTLLRGKSGIGKSECALALIERGHSLVADDLTYVQVADDTKIIGTSHALNRGYMECRGIGILNITELFGIRSVRIEKQIDLVITFTEWFLGMEEERTGLETNHFPILGINIPHIEIPVRPGRDLARLSEVGALVQALKLIGHDSAAEFNERLIAHMQNHSPR